MRTARLLIGILVICISMFANADLGLQVAIKARPKMVGEKIPPHIHGLTPEGEDIDLSQMMEGKFTLLAFTGAIAPLDASIRRYFNAIRPYIEDLGYQIIVVTTDAPAALQKVAKLYEHRIISCDEKREDYIAMGLADTKAQNDPTLNGIFLVAPDQRIVFEFVSADPALAISGEVLVLAAKNYRDLTRADDYKKKHGTK